MNQSLILTDAPEWLVEQVLVDVAHSLKPMSDILAADLAEKVRALKQKKKIAGAGGRGGRTIPLKNSSGDHLRVSVQFQYSPEGRSTAIGFWYTPKLNKASQIDLLPVFIQAFKINGIEAEISSIELPLETPKIFR